VSTTRRPYATTTLGNITVKSLFDTGADVSCIRTETFHKAGLDTTVQHHQFKNFKAAGGNSLKLSGKVKLPVTIDNKQVVHTFFLIDNLNEECILGIDFITDHQLSYCPQTDTLYWTDDKT